MKRQMKLKELSWHRNGVSGLSFHVAIVEEREGSDKREMLVIRFLKEADKEVGNIVCAAFDLALLDQRNIRFMENSWRGDHYHEFMDKEVKKAERRRKHA